MDADRHLVSYWDMSTINPPDLGWKGNGNDGVGSGLVAATDIVEGIAGGKAIEFNGSDEYITVPHSTSLDLSIPNAFTFALWYKTLDTDGRLLSKRDAGGLNWILSTDVGGIISLHTNGLSDVSIVTIDNFADNSWHHVVVTWSGSEKAIFIDGIEQIREVGITGIVDGGIGPLYIGRDYNTGHPYMGTIDSVRIYSAALTPLQVAEIFNSTRQGRSG